MFCLSKNLVELFKEKLKNGEINPEKLSEMSSKERRDFFSSFLGDVNAEKVNALFESKLLLKNQQQGIINWAEKVAGLKPEVKKDIISRVNKMENILNPKDADTFLSDIAAHKLGVSVTMEEAANISTMAKIATDLKSNIKEDSPVGSKERLDYGRARIKFEDYVNNLKEETKKVPLSEYLKPKNFGKAISNLAGLAKSMKASLDNSVIGRQGLKVLFTNPKIWLKNSKQSFVDIWNTFGGKEVMNEVRADILSRPNSLNGLYKKEGLAVGVIEEAYPTSLPEKIPVLGKAFKASETAYTAWQYRTRADIFDKYVEIADKTEADIKGIGKVANSLTGRGHLGAVEPVASTLNNIFFSPRFLKSNIDTLTLHMFDKEMSPMARKEAALNLLKIITGVSAILGIAKTINPDSVETDPRSSDFGKIKIGDTRFDVTGGMSSVVVLASRLIPVLWGKGATKSSITGIVTPLNSGDYGAKTGLDVLFDFAENKASPAAAIMRDILRGKDFEGKRPTLLSSANTLLTPIPFTNYQELKDNPNSANILAVMIADALGISANTYSINIDWTESNSKQLEQFREKVGEEEFRKANDKFNKEYKLFLERVNKDNNYQNLSEDDKKQVLSKEKSKIKSKIFQEYNFHYKKQDKKLPRIGD